MEIAKQNSNLTSQPKSNLSGILKTDDKVALMRYVGKLSMQRLHTDRLMHFEAKQAFDYLQAKGSDDPYIEKRLADLGAELEACAVPVAIRDMVEDQVLGDVTLLILDCEESLSLPRALSVSQVQVMAMSLIQRMAGYALEDIALVLHQGRMGQYGQVWRFDLNVVHTWVNQYLKDVKTLHASTIQNRHLTTKEGMSYDPRDKASVMRVLRDRGVDVDKEVHYEADKAEWAATRSRSNRDDKQTKKAKNT